MATEVIEGQGYAGQRSDSLLRLDQVAEILAISERSVHRLASTGELPTVRIGRSVRFERDDVRGYIDRCRVAGSP